HARLEPGHEPVLRRGPRLIVLTAPVAGLLDVLVREVQCPRFVFASHRDTPQVKSAASAHTRRSPLLITGAAAAIPTGHATTSAPGAGHLRRAAVPARARRAPPVASRLESAARRARPDETAPAPRTVDIPALLAHDFTPRADNSGSTSAPHASTTPDTSPATAPRSPCTASPTSSNMSNVASFAATAAA